MSHRSRAGWSGRDVEHLEVGEVVLDLGTLVDDEPELGEHLRDLACGLDDRVEAASPDRASRGRDVDSLGREPGCELGAPEPGSRIPQRRLDGQPDLVGHRPDLGPILGREAADPAQDRRQPALLAEHVDLERVERGRVRRGCGSVDRVRPQRVEVLRELREIHGWQWSWR